MKRLFALGIILTCALFSLGAKELHKSGEKILICGVCRNVGNQVQKTIENAEALGARFADYQVIFYENNSTDGTKSLFNKWARENDHVCFLSEHLMPHELPASRTEKIARARNIVLSVARDPEFADFNYLLMVDLDTGDTWPIDEVVETIHSERGWDCVAANDPYSQGGFYRDRYAFRDENYPLGPEIMGDTWWGELNKTWFKIDQQEWMPVFSAFGGFAIYRTKSILPFSYSGIVTKDLESYYHYIFSKTSRSNFHRILYMGLLAKEKVNSPSNKPVVVFQPNTSSERPVNYPHVTVCEHVPLHAAMAVHGYGRFYINPKMKIRFN